MGIQEKNQFICSIKEKNHLMAILVFAGTRRSEYRCRVGYHVQDKLPSQFESCRNKKTMNIGNKNFL